MRPEREQGLIFPRKGGLIAIDMVRIGCQQRLAFCRLLPLCQCHGVVRMRLIQFDKVQQMGTGCRYLFAYGFRKRRVSRGETGSPEEGFNSLYGMSGHNR